MRVIAIFFLLLLLSCHKFGAEVVYTIKIKNNSSRNVWYYVSYNLPDTTLEAVRPQPLARILPGDEALKDNHLKWENVIDTIPAKKIAIYIIDEDTLNTYDWNTIRSQYKIKRRLELSASDLAQLNWRVQYP
jgi:hypothetical protein